MSNMKFIFILVIPFLSVTTSSESTDTKNLWYLNRNKNADATSRVHYQIAYFPVDRHDSFLNNNQVLHSFPFFNIPPITKVPHQQDYYPNSYPQESNFFIARPVSAQKYLPPQYGHNYVPFFPRTEQAASKPVFSFPFPSDIGTTGLEFMSKVFDNVNHGINYFTRYLPEVRGRFNPRYEIPNSMPLGSEYGHKNWQVEYNYPTVYHGVNGRYNPNLEKGFQGLYHPGKDSVYGYNYQYGNTNNGYPTWYVPNNVDQNANYYF